MAASQGYYDWTNAATSLVDKVIYAGDAYQILEELGRGSYGCLFLGRCLTNSSYVAIKVLCKSGLDHQQLTLQHVEIDIQSSLQHPNLLSLYGVASDEDYIYMVMELCDQGDLFEFVIRNKIRDDLVATVYMQILEGVEHMHAQHVYHRDLKLENMLLKTGAYDPLECKVADFGLATREQYSTEFGCGSTSYLAPEHFDNRNITNRFLHTPAYDTAASDVWSLGILLITLLFGCCPWEEATWLDDTYREFKDDPSILKTQIFPTLSTECYNFIKAALSPNPAERPTVTVMKHQFRAIDQLVVDPEQNGDALSYDEERDWSVSILTTASMSDKASYDSAVFSGTY